MLRWFNQALLAVPLILMAAACGDDTPTTPTELPTQVTFNEVFSGTLNLNGAFTHPFVSQASGTVTATLTTVSPDSATVMGVSLGTWNGVSCQVVLANDRAIQGSVVIGTVSSIGSLCLRVYDVGSLVEPTSYEVQVVHP